LRRQSKQRWRTTARKPGSEAGRPVNRKPAQALEIPMAQLLADKKEAIGYVVRIHFKEPHHL
jgi:hypothetical protein